MLTRLKCWILNREAGKNADDVLNPLSIKNNACIADIGSGGGALTLAFAERVGEKGKVYAVDINSRNLFYLGRTAKKLNLVERIVLTLADEDDCVLPESVCDLVFSRNSFHHINNPGKYFLKAAKALKPSGIPAIIDYDGTRGLPGFLNHYTSPRKIKNILEQAGFSFKKSFDNLPGQSYQIFTKNG